MKTLFERMSEVARQLPKTDEADLIRRGDALNVIRDALLNSAHLGADDRQLVQRRLTGCLKRLWEVEPRS
jgi:hypothetical protein